MVVDSSPVIHSLNAAAAADDDDDNDDDDDDDDDIVTQRKSLEILAFPIIKRRTLSS